MKYIKYAACLLVLLLLLSESLQKPRSHQTTEFLMDTVVSVTAYGAGAEQAVENAFLRLREIDRKCSAHNPHSQLAKINAAPKDSPVAVDSDLYHLIRTALRFSETSDGLFDMTLLPVSNLWGFGTNNASVPTENALQAALQLTGCDQLILDDNTQTVTKRRDGVQLDLGGIAKGYASDEAIRILKESGIQSAYLDFGGNVAVIGGMPLSLWKSLRTGQKTRPFTIGLQKPDAPRGTVLETIALSNGFIVTSGDYERYFEQDGLRYHHILDPRTGHPAESSLQSVTVIAQSGLEADMLSTALFVAGKEKKPLLYASCDEIITVDNQMELTYVKKRGTP